MAADVPSALDSLGEIQSRARKKRVTVFLDYDGTLTRIVTDPGKAIMPESVRDLLVKLSMLYPVAVISGRDLPDLQSLVGISGIYYAGSHGFDISGPGEEHRKQVGLEYLPFLDHAEKELRLKMREIPGAVLERKRFSVAVHYRMVPEGEGERVRKAVERISALHPDLRKSEGKKVFEFQPDIDWHKGRAVLWILRVLGLQEHDVLPFYIGDDTTDEDAFRTMRDWGIGIVVMDKTRPTEARYCLRDPVEVETFLGHLLSMGMTAQ